MSRTLKSNNNWKYYRWIDRTVIYINCTELHSFNNLQGSNVPAVHFHIVHPWYLLLFSFWSGKHLKLLKGPSFPQGVWPNWHQDVRNLNIQCLWAVSQLIICLNNEYIGKSHSGIWKKHVFLMFRNTHNKGTTRPRLVIKEQYEWVEIPGTHMLCFSCYTNLEDFTVQSTPLKPSSRRCRNSILQNSIDLVHAQLPTLKLVPWHPEVKSSSQTKENESAHSQDASISVVVPKTCSQVLLDIRVMQFSRKKQSMCPWSDAISSKLFMCLVTFNKNMVK